MSLLVAKLGILSTVQDLGRTGYRSLGINPSGVMDRTAARIVNTLLGNDDSEGVLELHFPAGEFVFESEVSFAIGGADFGASLNGREVRNWSSVPANKGDVLKFSELRTGTRAYLAVAGGFRIDKWIGSKSTNMVASVGGLHGRRLTSGDRIEFAEPRKSGSKTVGPSMVPRYSRFPTVRVIAGAEFELLTAVGESRFLNSAFTLTGGSNRMGYRLSGEAVHLFDGKEMVSAAVSFGTIQLLPDGQLIVLMADHQTSGGYPRIANVIDADLPLLAQLGPGDGVSFHLVTIEEAERAIFALERDLNLLRVGVSLKRS